MESRNNLESTNKRTLNTNSANELSFKIILKFWKRKSQSFEVNLPIEFCKNEKEFIAAIKDIYRIEEEFCLEEIWVLQKTKSYDVEVNWIKECNGRIKLNVLDSYKEYLLKRGEKKIFDSPADRDD